MKIHSLRLYGQPKLPKPKELKGIAQSDTIHYGKKTKVSVFHSKDGKIWLKMRDFFSPSAVVPNYLYGAPLSVLIKEMMTVNRHVKSFIYQDAWGDIVLRNEAWLIVNGYFKDHIDLSDRLRRFEKSLEFDDYELENTSFSRMLEKLIK